MYFLSLSLLPLALPLASAYNSYRSAITDCLNAASVPILLSSSVGWSNEIQPYNLRLTPAPNVVAIPRNLADVQAAVKCAYNSNIKASVKGGGHSYGAYGLAGSLVIDMVQFQAVTLDKATNVASVGGGARLGNMAKKIFDLGGRALPHGTCPAVGIGGHAVLGGFGYSSRLWGLAVDKIIALDVVLANGTTATASPTSHPDLFWALRGAGPGFAIITTFHLQTLPAPPANVNYGYTFEFSSASSAASGFQYATNWAQQNAPRELGFGIYLGSSREFVIQGAYVGGQAAFNIIIKPLLMGMKSFQSGAPSAAVQQLGWIDSLTALAGAPLVTPVNGDGKHDTFYVKSLDTHQATPLSLTALKALFKYLDTTATPSNSEWFMIANLYGGPNSAITSFPPSTDPSSTSCYQGRESGFVLQLYGYSGNSLPPFNQQVIPFIKGMVDSMGSEAANLPAYAPYADTALSQTEAQTRYWGAAVPRLKTIKMQFDQKDTLFNPQGF